MGLGIKDKAVKKERTQKQLEEKTGKSIAKPVSVSMPEDLDKDITKHSNEIMIFLMNEGVSTRSTKSRFIQELLKKSLSNTKLVESIKNELKKELINK